MVSSDALQSQLRALAPLPAPGDGPGEPVVLEALCDSTGLSAGVLGRCFVLQADRCEVCVLPPEATAAPLTLICSPAPLFALSGLALSPDGSVLAVCGPCGLFCVSVSSLEGSGPGAKASRRPAVLLDLSARPGLAITRVMWLSRTSLLAVTSENVAHMFHASLAVLDPARVLTRASGPSLSLCEAPSRQEEAMREFAVDAASLGPDANELLFLLGSGDVLWWPGENKKVTGPLRWSPPASDNYGCDFCTALCLQAGPLSVLVVGTSAGQVFHCLLLRPSPSAPPHLAVFDAVDLELASPDMQIYLLPDPLVPQRYFVRHGAGVHAVHLTWLPELAAAYESAEGPSQALLADLPSSLVEHALCLQPPTSRNAGPGLAALLQVGPPASAELLCALKTGALLRCRLRPPPPPTLAPDPASPPSGSESAVATPGEDVVTQVRRLLAAEAFQPLLHSSDTAGEMPDARACLELLQKAGGTLARQFLQPLEAARALLARRLEVLAARRAAHEAQLNALEAEQSAAAVSATTLLERIRRASERGERLRSQLGMACPRLAALLPRRVSRAEERAAEDARRLQDRAEAARQWLLRTEERRQLCARMLVEGRRRQHQVGVASPVQASVSRQLRGVLKEEGERIGELIQQLQQLQGKLGLAL